MGQSSNNMVVVIGAGPIGLETAVALCAAGIEVTVLERGEVADHVRSWGHVRLFSPFGMNSSIVGREVVSKRSGVVPAADELLIGRDYVARYLQPLADSLEDRLRCGVTVCSIGRSRMRKGHHIGGDGRRDDPFELLVRTPAGESTLQARVVVDCSGTYGRHQPIGVGGLPCAGESGSLTDANYRLRDVLGADREDFLARSTLLVGSGYSAATAAAALAELTHEDPRTELTWLTGASADGPVSRVPNDPLVERDRVAIAANEMAKRCRWLPGAVVTRIAGGADGWDAEIEKSDGVVLQEKFDNVVVHTGLRPDTGLFDELQVHLCYATEGPMRLAAALMSHGSGDCLSQPEASGETLLTTEPDFYVLGAKSYGRSSHFLIQAGLRQIREIIPLVRQAVTR